MVRIAAFLIASIITVALAPDLYACGGLFSETTSDEVIAMSDVRVLLVYDDGSLDQYVQVGYEGKATNFAWVYPVANNPEVAEAKNSPFPALDEATRPEIYITTYDDSGGGGSCLPCPGAADGSLGDNSQIIKPPVKVWQSGTVGAFDYVVITATKEDDMLDWLNDNGFAVPTTTKDVIGHYVDLKWYFVAMKVSVQSSNAEVPSTTVIRLSYQAEEIRYPLRMLSLSPATQTSFEFYLISIQSDKELTPQAPFAAVNINESELEATSEETHNYDAIFASTLSAGGNRALVREYSSSHWSSTGMNIGSFPDGAILTRLRTTFTPDAMNQDLVFATKAYDPVSNQYHLVYDQNEGASFPLPLAFLLLVLGVHRVWRERRRLQNSKS